ncbi:uncharacterized protein ARMOST_11874 [Armillaria ostoyae]|uniref:Uncharacterized protein n=1 Tax=Armillaria ostoyae TaxID=47428 RepID=A0A284RIC1_ARMOS|nr:uncharacterized protein ARMOST_11874 [Armillaria ostoyae]
MTTVAVRKSRDSTYEKRTESNRYSVYPKLITFHPPSVAYDASTVPSVTLPNPYSNDRYQNVRFKALPPISSTSNERPRRFRIDFRLHIGVDFFADNVYTTSR